MTTPTGNQATVDSGIWQMRTITRGATDRITKYPTPSIGMHFAYSQGVHVLLTATNGGGTWKHRPGRAADRPFLRQIRTPQPKPGRSKATNGPTMPKRHLNALGFVSNGGVSVDNDINCSTGPLDAGEAVCSGCADYRQNIAPGPKSDQSNATIGTARSKLVGPYAYSAPIGTVSVENERTRVCPNRAVLSLISGFLSPISFPLYRGVLLLACLLA